MANFAIVVNNSVFNVIHADDLKTAIEVSPHYATVVETTDIAVGMGYTYDGTTFTAPVEGE